MSTVTVVKQPHCKMYHSPVVLAEGKFPLRVATTPNTRALTFREHGPIYFALYRVFVASPILNLRVPILQGSLVGVAVNILVLVLKKFPKLLQSIHCEALLYKRMRWSHGRSRGATRCVYLVPFEKRWGSRTNQH